ncbi:MAG TPA: molybdopterin-dependent oxidoreductase [Acidimicrobiales bacterium]|nr:molybdopterin-dependent oxidoreductase [Acidimicrobiales bacterium]
MLRSVAGRRTNLALLLLLVGAFVSGLLMWGIGSGWTQWPTIVHGTVGVAIVAMARWKSVVSRRGVHRRGLAAALPSLALAVLVAVALVSGFAHRAGARRAGPVLVMQIHVGAALAALPLVLWHIAYRPVRPRGTDLGRRTLLRGGLLVGGSAAVTVALPHAGRAATRSLERGSLQPTGMPVTQWLFDQVPPVDGEGWRLRVGERLWSRDELESLAADEVVATLDCTGGWYAEQRWGGLRVDRLLAASGVPAGRSIEVRSVTGYSRRFPGRDAEQLLVATSVGGAGLTAGHGFPARLVAPGRRGFWWVKWVEEITVDDSPWWSQPPFPLR